MTPETSRYFWFIVAAGGGSEGMTNYRMRIAPIDLIGETAEIRRTLLDRIVVRPASSTSGTRPQR